MSSPFVNQLKWRTSILDRDCGGSTTAYWQGPPNWCRICFHLQRMAPFVQADIERFVRRVNSQAIEDGERTSHDDIYSITYRLPAAWVTRHGQFVVAGVAQKQCPPSASHRRWANPLLNMGGVSGAAKSGPLMTTLIIDGLNRDVLKRRSIVTLKWENDPEKRLGLPVPFDCPLDTLRAEAEKAVRALAKELESATIQGP